MTLCHLTNHFEFYFHFPVHSVDFPTHVQHFARRSKSKQMAEAVHFSGQIFPACYSFEWIGSDHCCHCCSDCFLSIERSRKRTEPRKRSEYTSRLKKFTNPSDNNKKRQYFLTALTFGSQNSPVCGASLKKAQIFFWYFDIFGHPKWILERRRVCMTFCFSIIT